MKTNTSPNKSETKRMKQNSRLVRGLAPLAGCALLLPLAASAQITTYTGTCWVNQVLAPGIVCDNSAGQVLIRGIRLYDSSGMY